MDVGAHTSTRSSSSGIAEESGGTANGNKGAEYESATEVNPKDASGHQEEELTTITTVTSTATAPAITTQGMPRSTPDEMTSTARSEQEESKVKDVIKEDNSGNREQRQQEGAELVVDLGVTTRPTMPTNTNRSIYKSAREMFLAEKERIELEKLDNTVAANAATDASTAKQQQSVGEGGGNQRQSVYFDALDLEEEESPTAGIATRSNPLDASNQEAVATAPPQSVSSAAEAAAEAEAAAAAEAEAVTTQPTIPEWIRARALLVESREEVQMTNSHGMDQDHIQEEVVEATVSEQQQETEESLSSKMKREQSPSPGEEMTDTPTQEDEEEEGGGGGRDEEEEKVASQDLDEYNSVQREPTTPASESEKQHAQETAEPLTIQQSQPVANEISPTPQTEHEETGEEAMDSNNGNSEENTQNGMSVSAAESVITAAQTRTPTQELQPPTTVAESQSGDVNSNNDDDDDEEEGETIQQEARPITPPPRQAVPTISIASSRSMVSSIVIRQTEETLQILQSSLRQASVNLLQSLGNHLSQQGRSGIVGGISLPAAAVGWLTSQTTTPASTSSATSVHHLLPRLTHLRLTAATWPPTIPVSASSGDAAVSTSNNNNNNNNDNESPTLEQLQQQYASLQSFHRLRYNPEVDVSLFSNLRVLLLDQVPPDWIKHLPKLQTTLQVLRVERASLYDLESLLMMSPDDASDHQPPTSFSQLTHLKLTHCNIGEQTKGLTLPEENGAAGGGSQRLPLANMPRLTSLSLSHNKIRCETTILKSGISQSPLLSKLDLSHNLITSFGQAPHFIGNLQTLILTGNQLQSVVGLDRLYALQTLALDYNQIRSWLLVASLARLPELQSLKLRGNPFMDADRNYVRVMLLDLFREQRWASSISAQGQSQATFRQLEFLLPVLDDKPVTDRELKALQQRAFVTVPTTINGRAAVVRREPPVAAAVATTGEATSSSETVTTGAAVPPVTAMIVGAAAAAANEETTTLMEGWTIVPRAAGRGQGTKRRKPKVATAVIEDESSTLRSIGTPASAVSHLGRKQYTPKNPTVIERAKPKVSAPTLSNEEKKDNGNEQGGEKARMSASSGNEEGGEEAKMPASSVADEEKKENGNERKGGKAVVLTSSDPRKESTNPHHENRSEVASKRNAPKVAFGIHELIMSLGANDSESTAAAAAAAALQQGEAWKTKVDQAQTYAESGHSEEESSKSQVKGKGVTKKFAEFEWPQPLPYLPKENLYKEFVWTPATTISLSEELSEEPKQKTKAKTRKKKKSQKLKKKPPPIIDHDTGATQDEMNTASSKNKKRPETARVRDHGEGNGAGPSSQKARSKSPRAISTSAVPKGNSTAATSKKHNGETQESPEWDDTPGHSGSQEDEWEEEIQGFDATAIEPESVSVGGSAKSGKARRPPVQRADDDDSLSSDGGDENNPMTPNSRGSSGTAFPTMALEIGVSDDTTCSSNATGMNGKLKGPTKQDKFHLAEMKSKFLGMEQERGLIVASNLTIYFKKFVFPDFVPNLGRQLNDDADTWQSVFFRYPRIQLPPKDRELRDSFAKKQGKTAVQMQTASAADGRERFVKVWKEDMVACGKPALRRLPPNRTAHFGFHGELSWLEGKVKTVSECRGVIICLSNTSLYVIVDNDSLTTKDETKTTTSSPYQASSPTSVEWSPTKSRRKARKYPSPLPADATFEQALWPHAIACHPLSDVLGITIGFGFQRMTLRIRNSAYPSAVDFTYQLLTSNKMKTVDLLRQLQGLVKEVKLSMGSTTLTDEAIKIDNDDRQFLDALAITVAPEQLGAVLHYQILKQRWKHGQRGAVSRIVVVTDTKIFLLDEDYVGDGSESVSAESNRRLGTPSFRLIDAADLQQISEVRAADADPNAITIIIRPSQKLQRTHRWRLLCRDRSGAEKLVEDVRKAMALADL